MYSKFEDGENGCEDIPFYSSIKEELQRYQMHDLHRISDKIVKALCFIYNRKRNRPENFEEELCSYLYYWLGDIIYPSVKSQAVFSYIIKMIYTELYSNIRDDFIVCKNVYTPIDQDRFNKNKVLFDYSKDYHNIEIATPHGETTCDKDYRQYMENYISTYKQAHLDCNKGVKNNFHCEHFFTLFQEKQNNKLSSFSCRLSENGRAVLDNQKAHEEQEPVTDQSYRHTSITPPPYQIAEQEADLVMNQHKRGETFPTAFELSKMDDTAESGTSKTIAGSVAPVLGVSSISLHLYKLTPVGGYINRLLRRNRNMYNPAEYMDSFNPYSDGMIPGDRTMNISYNRL
ncbi:VIR protein [Plasmodium vivax]|uniref:VIR protein n=1 Tax=Plasmodium vivax TaxID=5855 RepID=A0A1G4E3D4_PLAVI|nr:VIR protein [Plasmodium vivax]